MYNSHLICTYSFYDSVLREKYHKDENIDLEDVSDLEDMSEFVYRAELLQAFGGNCDFDTNEKVRFDIDIIKELYNKIKASGSKFMECIEKATNKLLSNDSISGFILLFSYDYFFLTHKCLCDFLNGDIIDAIDTIDTIDTIDNINININNLKNAIN